MADRIFTLAEVLRPTLAVFVDGKEYDYAVVKEILAKQFKLKRDSSHQSIHFSTMISLAISYLSRFKFLEKVASNPKARKITKKGLSLYNNGPAEIQYKDLKGFKDSSQQAEIPKQEDTSNNITQQSKSTENLQESHSQLVQQEISVIDRKTKKETSKDDNMAKNTTTRSLQDLIISKNELPQEGSDLSGLDKFLDEHLNTGAVSDDSTAAGQVDPDNIDSCEDSLKVKDEPEEEQQPESLKSIYAEQIAPPAPADARHSWKESIRVATQPQKGNTEPDCPVLPRPEMSVVNDPIRRSQLGGIESASKENSTSMSNHKEDELSMNSMLKLFNEYNNTLAKPAGKDALQDAFEKYCIFYKGQIYAEMDASDQYDVLKNLKQMIADAKKRNNRIVASKSTEVSELEKFFDNHVANPFIEPIEEVNQRRISEMKDQLVKLHPEKFRGLIEYFFNSSMEYCQFYNSLNSMYAPIPNSIKNNIVRFWMRKLGLGITSNLLIYIDPRRDSEFVDIEDVIIFAGTVQKEAGIKAFISPRKFNKETERFANKNNIILVDGEKIVEETQENGNWSWRHK